MTAPATAGFISYSRRNIAFAERLHFDLERCGLKIWRDRVGIPSNSPGWWEELEGIATHSDFLLLLASPETGTSDTVHKELAEASPLEIRFTEFSLAGLTLNYQKLGELRRSPTSSTTTGRTSVAYSSL